MIKIKNLFKIYKSQSNEEFIAKKDITLSLYNELFDEITYPK